MKRVNTLLALDLSYMDKYLLNFLGKHHNQLGEVEKVFCLYVDKNPDIPDEVKQLLDFGHNEERFSQLIQDEFQDAGMLLEKHELLIEEGTFEEQMMNHIEDKKIGLVVLGHKPRTDGTGIRARRLACQTNTDVLFIPGKEINLKRIIVPVDFSDLSKKALKRACQIAQKIPRAAIHCIHVYETPIAFALNKTLHSEINQRMEKLANQKMEAFISDFDAKNCDFKTDTIMDEGEGLASIINAEAKKRQADMIVMGSRGETFIAWILMGSTAEKMIFAVEDIPLMIVK